MLCNDDRHNNDDLNGINVYQWSMHKKGYKPIHTE
jgi:hypothetical protein